MNKEGRGQDKTMTRNNIKDKAMKQDEEMRQEGNKNKTEVWESERKHPKAHPVLLGCIS